MQKMLAKIATFMTDWLMCMHKIANEKHLGGIDADYFMYTHKKIEKVTQTTRYNVSNTQTNKHKKQQSYCLVCSPAVIWMMNY